jgi:hypothetical protein
MRQTIKHLRNSLFGEELDYSGYQERVRNIEYLGTLNKAAKAYDNYLKIRC